MADSALLELLHAEIDGELDAQRRGELSRRLLADPEARALREDLRRLCEALDGLEQVEPPHELRQSILDALPQSTPAPDRSWWPANRVRYAAMVAAVLAGGAVMYEVVHGPAPSGTEAAGTLTPVVEPTVVDSVRLAGGPVSGRVSLYRDRGGLSLRFELAANAPVDALISGDGHTLRVAGVGGQGKPGQGKPGEALTVGLPGFRMGGETIDLAFLMDGRQVESATLRAPRDR